MPSDSPTPEGSSPAPFASEPQPLGERRAGCSRMLLMGCAAVAILVGVVLVAMMLKARDLVVWSLDNVRTQVEESLPADLPEVERERLARAFDATLERLRDGELDADDFGALQSALLDFARLGESVGREDVRELIQSLESFASDSPAAPEAPRDPPPSEPSTADATS